MTPTLFATASSDQSAVYDVTAASRSSVDSRVSATPFELLQASLMESVYAHT